MKEPELFLLSYADASTLNLQKVGRFKNLTSLHHLKRQMMSVNVWTYTLVCANQFCTEEATTYTWVKPRNERGFLIK